MLRPRVPWMNETDDAILELFTELDETGMQLWLAPTPVWINLTENLSALDKSRDTVSRRMVKLAEIGFLDRVDGDRGYYEITDQGRQYVAGELSAADIPTPDN